MQSGNNGNLLRGNPNWVKGQSANPLGRPKGEPQLTPELRRQLNQICHIDPQKRTWREVLVERTMIAACKGNPAAVKEVWERLDGKVKEQIQVDINLAKIRMMTDEELEREVANATVIDVTPEPAEQLPAAEQENAKTENPPEKENT